MSEASERWLTEQRAWVDEQMRQQRDRDEAAWQIFRAKLLGPLD